MGTRLGHGCRAFLLSLIPVLFSGCAGYSQEQSCADLASSVWPWVSMGASQATSLQEPEQAAAILPDRLVVVTGTLPSVGTYRQPVDAAFQCVYHGGLLQSFGWGYPPILAAPTFPVGQPVAQPAATEAR